MGKVIKDYGIIVTVKSAKNSYLFVDGIDRDRYIAGIIKMTENFPSGEILPVIAGLNSDSAQIVFAGGDEETLRRLMRNVHISYSAYRKIKKCPVTFGKSLYELIDGFEEMKKAKENTRLSFEFVCYVNFGVV